MSAIAPKLEQVEIERAKRKPTESLHAYDYYLRGTANLQQVTEEAVGEALRLSTWLGGLRIGKQGAGLRKAGLPE